MKPKQEITSNNICIVELYFTIPVKSIFFPLVLPFMMDPESMTSRSSTGIFFF